MVFNLMDKCHQIKQLVEVMIHSIPSLLKLVLVNMYHELFLSI